MNDKLYNRVSLVGQEEQSELDVINKFWLYRNNALWLDVASHGTILNQSQCVFIDSRSFQLSHQLNLDYFNVPAVPPAPGVPRVQDLKGTSAYVVWEDRSIDEVPDSQQVRYYTLETRRLRTSEWIMVRDKIKELHCIVDGLNPGECYSFRVTVQVGEDGERSEASSPSAPLSVPLGDFQPNQAVSLAQQSHKGRQLQSQVSPVSCPVLTSSSEKNSPTKQLSLARKLQL